MSAVNTDDEQVIHIVRKKSTTDTIRKASDPRILNQADLYMAGKIEKEKKQGAIGGEEDESRLDEDDNFEYSHGLTAVECEQRLRIHGPNSLPEKIIPKWYIFVSQLWQPMPLMIWAAALIEGALQNFIDMGILLMIQFANASIGFYEIVKAGDAVAALKASLKPTATVKRDGKWQNINATLVVPGDLVLLACGSAVPADCRINEGTVDIDQSGLTGESLPVTMFKGDSAKMGSTVVRGEVEGTVEFTGANTFFGKTAALLGGTNEHSNLQKILIRIMITLVLISSCLCLTVFIYLLQTEKVVKALSFTVVLMVASIPLAIEIVTTTTLALGSKELSHHGAIVARLAAIEDLAGMSILCSDKTGTLTMNKMEIQDHTPVYKDGEDRYTLLRYAAMAAKWKEPPRDALDTLTLTAVDMASLDEVEQLDYLPFDPITKRTEGAVKVIKTGEIFKTTKGAPHVLLKLVAASQAIEDAVEDDVHSLGMRGIRCLAVAKTNEKGKWEMLGLLTFLDPPRPDTKQTIEDAIRYGVAVKMITGDHLLIAKETARRLEMGDNINSAEGLPLLDPETKAKPENLGRDYGDLCLGSDGFAQVFPEHKYLIVECLRELGYKVGMTGDGVNDAPALKRADVGIAVAGATDAARAAADIVLTNDGLSTIIKGIVLSRCIFVRIKNFITYRVAATLQLLVFFFIAVFAFKPNEYQPSKDILDEDDWPSYFAIPVLLLMLITLLNDGTLIAIGYDNVIPEQVPEKWNLPVIFLIAFVMAMVSCVSSLILLEFLLDSWNPGSVFQYIGLGGVSYGQITTAIYLKVSVSDFLTLFSARGGSGWFWSSRPSTILMVAGGVALTISTILAIAWPASHPDEIYTLGLVRRKPYELFIYIWLYCIVWWFVQDACKVFTLRMMKKYNTLGINETGKLIMPESTLKFIEDEKMRKEQAEKTKGKGHH